MGTGWSKTNTAQQNGAVPDGARVGAVLAKALNSQKVSKDDNRTDQTGPKYT